MKKIVLLLVLISVTVNAQKRIKTTTYNDGIISLEYPKKWKPIKVHDKDEIASFSPKKETKLSFSGGFSQENINKASKDFSLTKVSIFRTQKINSVEEYINYRKELLEKVAKNLKSKTIKHSIGEAQILEYQVNLKNEPTQFIELNFKKSNFIYSVYYFAPVNLFQQYENEAMILINSLKIN